MSEKDTNNNYLEITSDYITLDANNKSILILNQTEEYVNIKTKEMTIECNDKITLKCGNNTIELSSNSITLKCGSSSIELSSSEINLKSLSINLG
ncbi:hypothetical protein IBE20_04510 [Francisella tularensis subsp. novicida]|uniref:Uncharacterized protein n=2 Tax=Francisella tularensis TaxID=263 RepID=A0A6I4RUV0_FRATU|nr:hypothetical protein [Francisella tularensis]ABK88949.1 hypothetical protein FTN_0038 [Francisella tularensis subsp. novicida U112]AJI60309.1 hypothetical protein AW25_162 [Francisella tularensis subsp. novicida U112]EDX19342.1 hypothetical protein FTE_0330 [Francisella tularensis subsp. novicida FTE]MBK2036005.1 hypothetical protein [Francisella tularensis subsp. novicida]MBK2115931.1 hypothetical protein [Francisella tularensis subsp. novicida]